jgi:hypothetical protein
MESSRSRPVGGVSVVEMRGEQEDERRCGTRAWRLVRSGYDLAGSSLSLFFFPRRSCCGWSGGIVLEAVVVLSLVVVPVLALGRACDCGALEVLGDKGPDSSAPSTPAHKSSVRSASDQACT